MELNRSDIISRLQSRAISIDEFNFERLSAPPIMSMFTQQDLDQLYYIATSARYSGNAQKRFKAIDSIMNPRGFIKLSSGTNRICYRCVSDDSFVVKVAIDKVGIGDNPKEFMNQLIFKPYVAKVFEVDPTGVLATMERVIPITSREEFASIAGDVFDVISDWFIGTYIMADIGTQFFMNWGIRRGFGPVLLDYPYAYELDGNKLYCSAPDDNSPTGNCEGEIDYDDGYNFLKCTKCGMKYRVRELAKNIKDETIIVKGRRITNMKVKMKVNGVAVETASDMDGLLQKETSKIEKPVDVKPATGLKVSMNCTMVPKKNNGNKNKGNNNGYRKDQERNRKNNRGIVTAPEATSLSNTKVKMTVKEEAKAPLSMTASSLSEYDKENNLFIFKDDKGNSAVIDLLLIPDEYKHLIVENSSDYTNAIKMINNLNAEIKEYDDKIASLIKDNDELEYCNKALTEGIDQATIDIEKYREEAETDKDTIHNLNGTIEDLESEIKDKNDLIEKLNTMLDMLEKSSGMSKDIANGMAERVEVSNDMYDITKKRNEELEAEVKSLNETINELNKTVGNLNTELEASRKDTSENEDTEDNHSKIVSKLTEENKALQSTIGDMTDQITKLSDENNELHTNLNKATEEVNSSKELIDKKEAQLEAVQNLLQEANDKIETLETSKGDKIKLVYDYGKECDIFDLFINSTNQVLMPVTGRVVNAKDFVPDVKDVENERFIIFPDGENDYLRDTEGAIIALVTVDGASVTELFEVGEEKESNVTKVPVGAVQQ